jgi:Putative transposase
MVFRAKFRDGLKQLFDQGQLQCPASQPRLSNPVVFASWLRHLCRRQWIVYTKRPFGGPQSVLAYLCRYTHRVAITNSRIEALDIHDGTVTFRYKDYAHESRIRSMTLQQQEFLRRFCLHILPARFVKIRHFGILSNPLVHLTTQSPHSPAGLRSCSAPREPLSAVLSTLRHQPDTDAFSCRVVERRGLSGSVQWQCICIGSGDVPFFSHTFGPNQCRYTTKHYVARNIIQDHRFGNPT